MKNESKLKRHSLHDDISPERRLREAKARLALLYALKEAEEAGVILDPKDFPMQRLARLFPERESRQIPVL